MTEEVKQGRHGKEIKMKIRNRWKVDMNEAKRRMKGREMKKVKEKEEKKDKKEHKEEEYQSKHERRERKE